LANDGGISRLQRRLAAIPRVVKEAVTPSLLRQANTMAGTMRQFAPDDPATNAPDLKSSIEVTGPGNRTPDYSQPGGSMTVPELTVAITVGNSDVRYPHLQEYGTTFHAAQPFFWPAVRLHNKKTKTAIKSAVRRAVKKNWGAA
jgi:HK97 gp10 family phage protein